MDAAGRAFSGHKPGASVSLAIIGREGAAGRAFSGHKPGASVFLAIIGREGAAGSSLLGSEPGATVATFASGSFAVKSSEGAAGCGCGPGATGAFAGDVGLSDWGSRVKGPFAVGVGGGDLRARLPVGGERWGSRGKKLLVPRDRPFQVRVARAAFMILSACSNSADDMEDALTCAN